MSITSNAKKNQLALVSAKPNFSSAYLRTHYLMNCLIDTRKKAELNLMGVAKKYFIGRRPNFHPTDQPATPS
jgi:hypothetical protein